MMTPGLLLLGGASILLCVSAYLCFVCHRLIKKIKLLEKDKLESARKDALTGCMNRPAWNEEASRLFARSRRHGSALAMIVVDADSFQKINQEHGREAGDLLIRGLAAVLVRNVREMDVVGRLDGVTFAILLPESGMVAAMLVAQRIRKAVALGSVTSISIQRVPVALTASFGVATLHDSDLSHLDALDRAERSLELAKDKGKNRVESESSLIEATPVNL